MIYLTGASGFLGNNLIQFFKNKDIEFKSFSRKKTNDALQIKNYLDIKENPNATILHLASESNTKSKMYHDEIEFYKNISKKKWKHQIFFSSAQIYDDQSLNLKTENSLIKPRNNYGKKKSEIEKIFLEIENATILRLSNIIGKGMSDRNVINTLLSQLNLGPTIKLENTYSVRDFLAVDDFVKILHKIIKFNLKGIFNISTGRGTQISQLTDYMIEIVNKYQYRLEVNDNSDRVSHLVLDNSKLKSLCDIEINLNVKKIIRSIIENKKI